MTCHVSGKMSQASENICKETTMNHQPKKVVEIF